MGTKRGHIEVQWIHEPDCPALSPTIVWAMGSKRQSCMCGIPPMGMLLEVEDFARDRLHQLEAEAHYRETGESGPENETYEEFLERTR